MTLLPALLGAACLVAQDSKPTAAELVADARRLLPVYEGAHRSFLSADERRDARAGAKLLEAALVLAPDDTSALWWLAHARVLLGEDRRNRGDSEAAAEAYDAARAALDRALEVDPDGPWAHYSLGILRLNLGDPWAALPAFDRAIELTGEVMRWAADAGNAPWLRYHARSWRAEALLRAGRFDEAREAWRSFYADHGDNAWDRGMALARAHLRERDFAGAEARLSEVVAAYPSDFAAYAERGYSRAAQGDWPAALADLEQAIALELEPTLYPRLWRWIVATSAGDASAEQARADLAGLLEHPPRSLSEWDLGLGRFLLGAADVEGFLERALAERERRLTAGEELDQLACEASFYAGLRLERDGRNERALAAYRDALATEPVAFKWEWAFARMRFAETAALLGRDALVTFTIEGERITLTGAAAERAGTGAATVEQARWHAPGADGPVAAFNREPLPGDLLQCVLRDGDGRRALVHLVVEAAP